ncbi:hypothetical protein HJB51_18675 [Rhizobium lentis]|uniref:hypothetical protein n=1 Tax=Rhizobium lentis TaxID=1138194 RepID=UPI001C83C100|nr:hypothetical protein [Rhizobium lentis]MBX5042009.1 hypothetical protein [Rhizobium lentis]MBX5053362.1 hypothetical protein [Rhizobium lentis]MBX5072235.1 hypothetical protein [Rhizobium lentis]MBX5110004.1 hypothetical protein [Rhizobium lentis]MBX5115119.1 hypothetical protein [Rhizobium lentis]
MDDALFYSCRLFAAHCNLFREPKPSWKFEMIRSLSVRVDQRTWPVPPALPQFPTSFVNGLQTHDFDIPSVLLTIGYLTTPSHVSGVSLSEFWAWVRYLHAISPDPDLRLTRPFSELDAHQKTILSDDFGMGVPMSWLLEKLQLGPIADGRYFVERLAATAGAETQRPSKKGPRKTPDFVARDGHGVWHVIECKGTQSGSDYRDRQLGGYNPQTGAIAQKNTIRFPPGHTGQRLGCGLQLGVEGSANASSLRIVDPPVEDDDFVVRESDLDRAADAIERAIGARALRLAGFQAASMTMSAPAGPKPTSQPLKGKKDETRKAFVAEKVRRADAELDQRTSFERFDANKQRFRGRIVKLDLPVPIVVNERLIRSVMIRNGISEKFIRNLRGATMAADMLGGADLGIHEQSRRTYLEAERYRARLSIGSLFVSEIHFAEKNAGR